MNRLEDAFSKIKAEDALKKNTLQKIEEYRSRKKSRSLMRTLRFAASAACIAVLVFLGGMLYTTQTALISIDVNPSIELSLNRFNRVLSAVPKNADAESVLSGLELTNMKYTDALSLIMDTEQTLGYLNDESDIVFAVQSDDSAQQENLMQESQGCAQGVVGAQRTTCYAISEDDLEQANQYGISPGKYKAIQELQEYDSSVSFEEYANYSMRAIRQKLMQYQSGDFAENNGTAVSPQGSGYQNGKNQGQGGGSGNGNSGGNGNGNGSSGVGRGKNSSSDSCS